MKFRSKFMNNINNMNSALKGQEYSDLRSNGKLALATVLKQEKSINIIEKYINKNAKKKEDYDSVYKKILYQTVGDILKGKDLKILVNDLKKEMVCWNHCVFTNMKNRIDEHDEFIINPFEVEEGVTICKCGSGRVFTYQRQVRSCDEPMTTFAQCVECKAKWKYSG
jgi:DNA-directed RNA polymerase subunit M/transcription elongation factor TFIIS